MPWRVAFGSRGMRFPSWRARITSGAPRRWSAGCIPAYATSRRLVSFVGAAVALADLDADGLPNDVLLVDPRIDQVIVAPAPGTGGRYEPFAMSPAPLPYDPATMAPVGCLPGDFNEDGRTDVLVYYWGRSPIVFLRRADEIRDALPSLTRPRFVARELIEAFERWYTGSATQADLDGDGHVDLIVGNYFPDGARILDAAGDGVEAMPDSLSRAYNGGRKHLFLSAGSSDGPEPSVRFREVKDVLDEEVARGWTFAIGAADLDGDLLPELYFVHDFGPDRLLHNRSQPGRLRFARLDGERTIHHAASRGARRRLVQRHGDGLWRPERRRPARHRTSATSPRPTACTRVISSS